MANRDLVYIGVSGDGDTASIGMGQFAHVVRRNLNMVYIVMNNGCYGLTKGQDSATADKGSASKKGLPNPYEGIDLCEMAIQLGAGFAARSFSGDKEQLIPLIKAAVSHQGFALIDVLSPCVTFNNNTQSTKNYDFVREHVQATGTFDFVPMEQEITTSYQPGKTEEITLHDGSVIHLHKSCESLDLTSRRSALNEIENYKEKGQILTGLLYLNPETPDTHELMGTTNKPLNSLSEPELCPGSQVLESINESFR